MEFIRLLASIRRHRISIVLIAVTVAVLGAWFATAQAPTYSAASRIVLGPGEDIGTANDQIQVGQVLNHPVMAANMSEIITSDRVLSDARWMTGASAAQIEEVEVEAIIAPESNVIEVIVAGPSEDLVLGLIEPVTAESVVLFEEIYPVFRAEVIDLAPVPDTNEPPGPIVGGLIGLFVGLVLAVFVGLFIDAIKNPRPEIVRDRGPWLPRRLLAAPGLEPGEVIDLDADRKAKPPVGHDPRPRRARVEASQTELDPSMFDESADGAGKGTAR